MNTHTHTRSWKEQMYGNDESRVLIRALLALAGCARGETAPQTGTENAVWMTIAQRGGRRNEMEAVDCPLIRSICSKYK